MIRSFSKTRRAVRLLATRGSSCPACCKLVQARPGISSSSFASTSRQLATLPLASTSRTTSNMRNGLIYGGEGNLALRVSSNRRTMSADARLRGLDEFAHQQDPEETALDVEKDSELAELLEAIEKEDEAVFPPSHSSEPTPVSTKTAATLSSPPLERPRNRPLDPQTLLKPSIPAGEPTLHDLNDLRPRRMYIPTAESEESIRIMYAKVYGITMHKMSLGFNKNQIRRFLGPKEAGGLGLDMTSPELRNAYLGKKAKFWKPKKLEAMNKNELIKTIITLEWGMVEPKSIATMKTLLTSICKCLDDLARLVVNQW